MVLQDAICSAITTAVLVQQCRDQLNFSENMIIQAGIHNMNDSIGSTPDYSFEFKEIASVCKRSKVLPKEQY